VYKRQVQTNINVTDSLQIQTLNQSICANDSVVNLSAASPIGGIYQGIGIVNDTQLLASTLGSGTYELFYIFDAGGCTAEDSITISINDETQVIWPNIPSYCFLDTAVTLNGALPSGGTYSGSFVNNGIFNPALAGIGTHTVDYAADTNGCAATRSFNVIVADGQAQILNLNDTYCENGDTVALQGIPSNGTFTGPGMFGNLFVPSIAGSGTITLSYSNTGSCADTVDYTVDISPAPSSNAIQGPTIVEGTSTYSYLVPASNGSSYQWSVIGGNINFTASNAVNVPWLNNSINGVLTLVETNRFGGSDTIVLNVDVWPLGTLENNTQSLVTIVFPNPVQDKLNIMFDGNSRQVAIKLYDGIGNQLFNGKAVTQDNFELDMTNYSQGIYFLEIQTEDEFIIHKAVVYTHLRDHETVIDIVCCLLLK